jgi:hypothetical protein
MKPRRHRLILDGLLRIIFEQQMVSRSIRIRDLPPVD